MINWHLIRLVKSDILPESPTIKGENPSVLTIKYLMLTTKWKTQMLHLRYDFQNKNAAQINTITLN